MVGWLVGGLLYLGVGFCDGDEGVGEHVCVGHGFGRGALLFAAGHVEFGHTVVLGVAGVGVGRS